MSIRAVFFSVKYSIRFQNQSSILETKALFNLETKKGDNDAETYSEPCETSKMQVFVKTVTQPAITCSKLTIEILEQGVKYVPS